MAIARLERTTGKKFSTNRAYGNGVRLCDEYGAHEFSPRVPTRELYNQIHTALNIIQYMREPQEQLNND